MSENEKNIDEVPETGVNVEKTKAAEAKAEKEEATAEETKVETTEAVVDKPNAEVTNEAEKEDVTTKEVVTEEPAAEEAVKEEPVAEEIIKEKPATEEAVAEPIAKEEPVTEKDVAEKPAAVKDEPEEFDWDALNTKQDTYSKEERAKLEGVYEETLSSITEHEVIEGTVVSMNSREVVVNIGYKSDGVLPFNEFRYNPDLKVGDVVEIYVENQEDASGQMILSHKKARILKSWERINEAYEKEEIINGYVKSRTKGGLIVDVFGIEAFLPGSQIDVKPIRDYDVFVNKTME
ncbi:SSU ribosomal protein S1p, partial [hydrothermal vent metagenome]